MNKPIIILGAGGHSKVLIDILKLQSVNILGITDPDSNKFGQKTSDIPVIGNDDLVLKYSTDEVCLIKGIGAVDRESRCRFLFEKFKNLGYMFASVIHPSAVIASDVQLSEGVQIMAGAVIQTGNAIGVNSIINTRATVDHDTYIGKHVHIAPGVTISGGVRIDDDAFIGTGATLIQGIKIGTHSLVAAGAVVIHDVPEGATVMGVPAKVVRG